MIEKYGIHSLYYNHVVLLLFFLKCPYVMCAGCQLKSSSVDSQTENETELVFNCNHHTLAAHTWGTLEKTITNHVIALLHANELKNYTPSYSQKSYENIVIRGIFFGGAKRMFCKSVIVVKMAQGSIPAYGSYPSPRTRQRGLRLELNNRRRCSRNKNNVNFLVHFSTLSKISLHHF